MVLISIRFMARKDGPAGVSVPLRGLWFLFLCNRDDLRGDIRSFRPLAGIMVLIKVVAMWIKQKTLASFRPLAGIMVLIWM